VNRRAESKFGGPNRLTRTPARNIERRETIMTTTRTRTTTMTLRPEGDACPTAI
jgi:hypothetical protein